MTSSQKVPHFAKRFLHTDLRSMIAIPRKPEDIIITYDANKRIEIDPEIQSIIDEHWKSIIIESEKTGRLVFNGEMMFPHHIEKIKDTFVIQTCQGWFKDLLGKNKILDEFKKDSDAFWKRYHIYWKKIESMEDNVNSIGSMTALMNKKYILMGKKGKKAITALNNKMSFPGTGAFDPTKDTVMLNGKRITLSTKELLLRELKEETGIRYNDIHNVTVYGMARSESPNEFRTFGINAIAETNLEKEEILEKASDAKDKWEHEALLFVPKDDPELLEALVYADQGTFGLNIPDKFKKRIITAEEFEPFSTVTQSQSLLLMCGRHLFGMEWYEKIRGKLLMENLLQC